MMLATDAVPLALRDRHCQPLLFSLSLYYYCSRLTEACQLLPSEFLYKEYQDKDPR